MTRERELERLLSVNGTLPFKTVRCWEWNYDSAPCVGGQVAAINPDLDRANIAIFVFKEQSLTEDWTAPGSISLKPTTDYLDIQNLKHIVLEQMKSALSAVTSSSKLQVGKTTSNIRTKAFLGDYSDQAYDQKPVLTHSIEELDTTSIKIFLEKPLARERLKNAMISLEDSNMNLSEKMKALGCLCDQSLRVYKN